ncbi:hypothetical protein ALO52_200277 [Pseudomonas syringae pv. primulae]|jgi:type I restriction enzyme M protein|uniref:Transposase n=1 Tax=Pseudomonas syringae pv. primulae TaxID=251707 RepID=A0A0N8SKY5_9PSED|nr:MULTISPECIES: N-6 DNA methylase [Pseudomonas syringae group]KPY36488.1 hypothetical protein ALO52_200277 [Pseudomonas syringae pv. primulae]MCF5734251.1 N-6 DNA methylase [Pseudomonas syringae]MCF5739220.1 N-6 DNA methylase [Pseudomonas syringae]MCF5749370.1 N-6 DNA methylase [Pseudomonas syringae]MCF5753246.1 N-6 DNA methylase [Pseudomonas syringae]
MDLRHLPKTSDLYGRYYTAEGVAGLLIDRMSACSPSLVIDLGAGDGALVGAASLHWDQAKFITVDIDQNAGSSSLSKTQRELFTHHVGDALDGSIDEKIGVPFGSVDSALCNPPYIRPKWQKHFGEILEDAGLSHILPQLSTAPAEVLFIAQNLRFIKSGGKLGLILPDGIVAGEKYSGLRKVLATSHSLERVVELPRGVFKRTDAKAHIVILRKSPGARDAIKVQRLESNGLLSREISVSAEEAGTRLDYSYLVAANSDQSCDHVLLRDITTMLRRGTFSSSELKTCPLPVFHTTNFVLGQVQVPPNFTLLPSVRNLAGGIEAIAGDILLARVGRNLEEKVCVVEAGVVLVSDCVFILRVAPFARQQVLGYLTGGAGRAAIRAIAHGVGARFITTEALLDLKIPRQIYER